MCGCSCFLLSIFMLIILTVMVSVQAYPEQGVFRFQLTEDNSMMYLHRTLRKGTVISVEMECKELDAKPFSVKWLLRESACLAEYPNVAEKEVAFYLTDPLYKPFKKLDYSCVKYSEVAEAPACDDNYFHFTFHEDQPKCESISGIGEFSVGEAANVKGQQEGKDTSDTAAQAKESSKEDEKVPDKELKGNEGQQDLNEKPNEKGGQQEQQKDVEKAPPDAGDDGGRKRREASPAPSPSPKPAKGLLIDQKFFSNVAKAWEDGIYLFALRVNTTGKFNIKVEVHVKHGDDYLSAKDRPFLVFYGLMCGVYIIYSLTWLLMSCCYWRDMLRVQYWIGLVILLGLVEKAFFLGEYSSLHQTGQSVPGVVLFAEIMSALKRALARMLVVIVSLGFGIVKPRLGPALHKVLGMGAIYFLIASVEGYMRNKAHSRSSDSKDLFVAVPLNILDAVIFYWVFVSITQTLRTLRLRRNVVKLSLYRHFTNCLIVCLLAAVGFMIWSIYEFRSTLCPKTWKAAWLDDAYWHLLFSIILLVIIILWRPSQNNQRYAFSPLLDAANDDSEEEEEFTKSGAYEQMKSRGRSPARRKISGSDKTVDDDLKWVEENIPSSAADVVLPVLDSDEEVMNTRLELSKME